MNGYGEKTERLCVVFLQMTRGQGAIYNEGVCIRLSAVPLRSWHWHVLIFECSFLRRSCSPSLEYIVKHKCVRIGETRERNFSEKHGKTVV